MSNITPSADTSLHSTSDLSASSPALSSDRARGTRLCCIDDVFNIFLPLPYPLVALIIAILWWGFTVTPLAIGGQLHLGDDLPILLGVVGIAVCTGFSRWGTLRYRRLIDPVKQILEDSSHSMFDNAYALTLKRMATTRGTVGVAIALWVIVSTALSADWLHGARTQEVPLLFDFMPPVWYSTPGIGWRLAAVIIMALPAALIVWTCGRLLLLHTFLILSLRQMQFISSPATCTRVLRPSLTFGVICALFWAFGIILFIILFRGKMSNDRILFLSMLSAVGTFGFVIPILGLRANLLRIQEKRLEHLTQLIVDKVKGTNPDPALLEEINELEQLAEADSHLGPVLMGWRYVAWFVTVILIPICFILLQYALDKLLDLLKIATS